MPHMSKIISMNTNATGIWGNFVLRAIIILHKSISEVRGVTLGHSALKMHIYTVNTYLGIDLSRILSL